MSYEKPPLNNDKKNMVGASHDKENMGQIVGRSLGQINKYKIIQANNPNGFPIH